jgi:hypothetical protein
VDGFVDGVYTKAKDGCFLPRKLVVKSKKVDKVFVELVVKAGKSYGFLQVFFEGQKVIDHVIVDGDRCFFYVFLFGVNSKSGKKADTSRVKSYPSAVARP